MVWKCINFLSHAITIDIKTLRFNLSKIAVYSEIGLNDGILLFHGK